MSISPLWTTHLTPLLDFTPSWHLREHTKASMLPPPDFNCPCVPTSFFRFPTFGVLGILTHISVHTRVHHVSRRHPPDHFCSDLVPAPSLSLEGQRSPRRLVLKLLNRQYSCVIFLHSERTHRCSSLYFS